tara:strand:+ start:60 stop:395 length:336 start_codon:yes stop_codon:yes gene_type:complete
MIKKQHKRSLGGLRKNHKKTQASQPDYLGRYLFKRETIQQLYDELKSNPNDLIECGLAGWNNQKRLKHGFVDKYTTIEVRPLTDKQTRFHKPDDDENPLTNLEAFFGDKYD